MVAKLIANCRSLLAGDSASDPVARVPNRLQAGSSRRPESSFVMQRSEPVTERVSVWLLPKRPNAHAFGYEKLRVPLRILLAGLLLANLAHALTVDKLRVEYLDRPLGLDAAQPRFAWILHSEQRGEKQSAYHLLVASSLENLAAGRGDVWDTGKVTTKTSFGIEYAGPALRSGARYYWQVRVWDRAGQPSEWSKPSWWQMAPLSASNWSAHWIGAAPDAGSPLLRRAFRSDKPVVRATAHAYAAGWYRLFVNGREITERVLSPVNSNYAKGLFFDSYDVTPLLRSGENALGMWLGYGYSQNYSKYGYRWDVPPAALVQLEIEYGDGSSERVVTDAHWRWAPSPILANDIYNGETYDARREIPGWSAPHFDDRVWQPVVLRDSPPGPLKACPFPGLAIVQEIRPVKVSEPTAGVFVFDLGQNIAGWVRLNVCAPAGTSVTLRHAEEIHPDGTLDVTTNRAAKATDTYIAAGRGAEIYEPRFTYHGFRYVEVTGLTDKPSADALTGRVVRAAVEEAGTFQSSNPLLNRLHANFKWSIAGNLVGIPTDTAARDERTPCQMDSMAVEDAAIANFGLGGYYAKWLNDISGDGGNLPGWTGDQVLLPFRLYLNYGDRRVLERHFENMKQVVEKFAATAEESKYWAGGFGDWAAPNRDGSYEGSFSEGELVNLAFFIRCAETVATTATILGQPAEAGRFARLAEQLRSRFNERLYRAASYTYSSGRQVTSVLPLAFALVPVNDRWKIFDALRRRIVTQDGSHLDTGIFGTRYLFEVLMQHGATDLAYQLLTAPGYPGYVDQINQGATTTWEQWQFAGSMQTHNHAMFAGPDATLFSHFGGIRPLAPGFREVEIRPYLPAALSYVECSRETPMGKVSSRWERNHDQFTLRVSIPVGVRAVVHLPGVSRDSVLESGRPAKDAEGVSVDHSEYTEGGAFVVGSGNYTFTAPLRSDSPSP